MVSGIVVKYDIREINRCNEQCKRMKRCEGNDALVCNNFC